VTIELLRKRFTPESNNPLWLHAMRGEGRVGLPCPSCLQPMIGVALSERAEINVDVCQHCHFIWFDAHEVDTLVPRPPASVSPELPQKAREMLAIAEVERLSKQAEGPDLDSAAPEESWKQIAAFLGMPVEFDEPEEQRRPWATWLLSAAIICVSLVAFSNLREVVQRFGLIPAQATRLGGLTFVTSFFLHAGIIHLAGNMYFLLAFGHAVENFLRPLRYLALIALAAFIGDLAHIALDPRSQVPCIGASGGIAGFITFYALNFPRLRLAFLMRYGFVWFRWIRLPAWFIFVLWFLFQLIGTLEQKAGMSSVSSAAHLGGATVGLLAWLVWRKPNDDSRLLE
jgi:membrane associated rhomboid family serine protease/Zn-finger nucleic acid-binding protein